MATLVLKNTTGADITIADASAVIIPAGGQDTFTDRGNIVQLSRSADLQAFVIGGQIVVNDGVSDLIVAIGLQYLATLGTQSGFDSIPGTVSLYQMQLGGALDAVALPLVDCGSEIVDRPKTFAFFRGRRVTPGSAGTTTIQLELNGSPIVGATLSWTPADAAFAPKIAAITLAAVPGDRISFRLTSAETGAEDVIAEVD